MEFENMFDHNEIENNYDDILYNNNEHQSIWVFGYGSLCWYPGFQYEKCITGYIRGYLRRFWQGNTTHRGTEEKPGRVVTLIEDKEGITFGCAYKIVGESALEYLKERECTLGGYKTLESKFFPRIAFDDTELSGEAFIVQIYIATEENEHWMGEAPLYSIAEQIANCSGPSGHNVEYLLRLAAFMHDAFPNIEDDHLFLLEKYVLEVLCKLNIPLVAVMGANPQRIRRDSHEYKRCNATFEFVSRIPTRKLRCLNI